MTERDVPGCGHDHTRERWPLCLRPTRLGDPVNIILNDIAGDGSMLGVTHGPRPGTVRVAATPNGGADGVWVDVDAAELQAAVESLTAKVGP